MAADVGKRVAWRRREHGGMSAQKLANRCAELGMPSLSRIVITKLENGHREAVSVAELMILAQALDVSPIELLFPIGREGMRPSEIAPGRGLSAWDAALWFMGQAGLRVTPEGLVSTEVTGPDDVVPLFVQHDELVERWRMSVGESRTDVARDLWRHRSRMRKLGLTLPDLPLELHLIDQGRNDEGP